ncbi:hypothetical protein [Corallincola spongiicola]|uniref:Uncharacterized protein n=1 Tax=Corallincola spongiicola TaxID=2520508 RepID=A0ABY1WLP1_9GAMM|nr:hypothetical protein [Corallincola spongiicola]TAA41756.1 hypothetical protein EXY25_16070 [Corallincola spongiicola]
MTSQNFIILMPLLTAMALVSFVNTSKPGKPVVAKWLWVTAFIFQLMCLIIWLAVGFGTLQLHPELPSNYAWLYFFAGMFVAYVIGSAKGKMIESQESITK